MTFSWSSFGSEKVEFSVLMGDTLEEQIELGRAESEAALNRGFEGQFAIEARRAAVDAELFGTEENPRQPTAEELSAFVEDWALGERKQRARRKKVQPVKAAELEKLSKADMLERLRAEGLVED